MKAVDKSVIRIRAEDAQAAALWTLPVVKSAHVVGLQEKTEVFEPVTIEDEIVAEKVTLSELEKIREDAYQEGLAQGRRMVWPREWKKAAKRGCRTACWPVSSS